MVGSPNTVSITMGDRAAAAAMLLGFAIIAVALLLFIGLVVWSARWHVDPKGIGGRNIWLAACVLVHGIPNIISQG
jgi:hypothetical protein